MKKRKNFTRALLIITGAAVITALLLEIVIRIIIDLPVKTDFYSSIKRTEVVEYQKTTGIRVTSGPGWIHLGWIAHPERENYRVYRIEKGKEHEAGTSEYGSYLSAGLGAGEEYIYRVKASSGAFDHTVRVRTPDEKIPPVFVPRIAGPWRPLFRPCKSGDYINDHTIYRSHDGKWHLLGITAFGEGDYSREFYFAHGVSDTFPPPPGKMMAELDPVADHGRLAWAPHVIREDRYYLWYSPHRCYISDSRDGRRWESRDELSFLPHNPQFRDPMVLKVADGQWLMYCTARDGYYSSVDIYQSFDLRRWQYIRSALSMGYGAELAGAQASTESPFVLKHRNRYYLSFTYNNGSFFWNPLLLSLKIWPGKESYNTTMIFTSANPYSFGSYHGRKRPSALTAVIQAHAPEYVFHNGRWYITTAGWPWAATLTRGECAAAELTWDMKDDRGHE